MAMLELSDGAMNDSGHSSTPRACIKPRLSNTSLLGVIQQIPVQSLHKTDASADTTGELWVVYDNEIGKGTFGTVIRSTIVNTKEVVAIKRVKLTGNQRSRELEMMKMVNHFNIIKARSYYYMPSDCGNARYLHIVMDFYPKSLKEILVDNRVLGKHFPLPIVKIFGYQLFKGLSYLHKNEICHRDLKPDNILVDPETKRLIISDLGSATIVIGPAPASKFPCTRSYLAIELLLGCCWYNTKVDVWSAGCIMAEMFTNKILFHENTRIGQIRRVFSIIGTPSKWEFQQLGLSDRKLEPRSPTSWEEALENRAPPDAILLFSKVLNYLPVSRLTALEVCANSFFEDLRTHKSSYDSRLFLFTKEEMRILEMKRHRSAGVSSQAKVAKLEATVPVIDLDDSESEDEIECTFESVVKHKSTVETNFDDTEMQGEEDDSDDSDDEDDDEDEIDDEDDDSDDSDTDGDDESDPDSSGISEDDVLSYA